MFFSKMLKYSNVLAFMLCIDWNRNGCCLIDGLLFLWILINPLFVLNNENYPMREWVTTFLRIIIVKWSNLLKSKEVWVPWGEVKYGSCMNFMSSCFDFGFEDCRTVLRFWFRNVHVVSFGELSRPHWMIWRFTHLL